MPMRVIGMLFGIPEADQEAIRLGADATLRTEAGQPMEVSPDGAFATDMFAEYIDWRVEHPSDDLMTDLLRAELAAGNKALVPLASLLFLAFPGCHTEIAAGRHGLRPVLSRYSAFPPCSQVNDAQASHRDNLKVVILQALSMPCTASPVPGRRPAAGRRRRRPHRPVTRLTHPRKSEYSRN
jgi:hypothetical protein